MKNEKDEFRYQLVIIGIALLMVSPILSRQYFWAHDSAYHVANIKAIVLNVLSTDGIRFPQKVVPLIGNDLGYGAGIFYPKLPHYFAALVHIIIMPFSANFDYTLNIVHFLVIYLSGIFMFKFSNLILSDKIAALLATVLYMTFPYFLTDIYVRNAFAESFIFIFVPMVFLSIYYLVNNNKNKFYIYFVIGYVGGVYSHTVMMCYVTIFLLIAMVLNLKTLLKRDKFISLIKASIIILLLISPSVLPLMEHKFKGNYMVFSDGGMSTGPDVVASRSLLISEYFNYDNFLQMGIIHLILCVIGIYYFINTKNAKGEKRWISTMILITGIAFVMTLNVFPWEHMPDALLKIQFPWRLQLILAFGMSILGGFSLFYFERKDVKALVVILIMLSSTTSLYFVNSHADFGYLSWNQLDMNNGLGGTGDYLPMNTYQGSNYDYVMNRNNDVVVIDGVANVENLENETPYLKCRVDVVNDVATLELPRLYYLGYDITLDDGESISKIDYNENAKGLIEITIDKSGILEVEYGGTFLNKIAVVVFIVITLLCLIWLCYTYRESILMLYKKCSEFNITKKVSIIIIIIMCLIIYSIKAKNYFSSVSIIERIAPLNINYTLGSDITFSNEAFNADKYVTSGLGERSNEYTLMESSKLEMQFRTDINVDTLEGTLDLINKSNDAERIVIYCNSQEVYNDDIIGDEIITFNYPNNNKASNYYKIEVVALNNDKTIGIKDISFRNVGNINSEYSLGSEINFYGDEYNGYKYVKSGLSNKGNDFTWTQGEKLELGFELKSNASSFVCDIDLEGAFNDKQDVTILINDNIVFNESVKSDDDIQFNFDNNSDGQFFMQILLPDAVSPKDLGQSEDDRKFGIGLKQIVINEN